MSDRMEFPPGIEEFLEQCSIVDDKEVYTNGVKLVPLFRVEQALEHYYPNETKNDLKAKQILCDVSGCSLDTPMNDITIKILFNRKENNS